MVPISCKVCKRFLWNDYLLFLIIGYRCLIFDNRISEIDLLFKKLVRLHAQCFNNNKDDKSGNKKINNPCEELSIEDPSSWQVVEFFDLESFHRGRKDGRRQQIFDKWFDDIVYFCCDEQTDRETDNVVFHHEIYKLLEHVFALPTKREDLSYGFEHKKQVTLASSYHKYDHYPFAGGRRLIHKATSFSRELYISCRTADAVAQSMSCAVDWYRSVSAYCDQRSSNSRADLLIS